MLKKPLDHEWVYAALLKTEHTPKIKDDTICIRVPPGPVSKHSLYNSIGYAVTDQAFLDVYTGFCAMRQAVSSELSVWLALQFFDRNQIARAMSSSGANLERLEHGGAVINWLVKLDIERRGTAGRPKLTQAQREIRAGLAMSVARIMVLEQLAHEKDQQQAFDAAWQATSQTLDLLKAQLFNLNSSHSIPEGSSALAWCEREGPQFMERAYGRKWGTLKHDLLVAFKVRVSGRGFVPALDDERRWLNGMASWAHALQSRKEGERSRADTIARAKKRGTVGGAGGAGDELAAPRMHSGVRTSLIAESRLEHLSPQLMVELSVLFGLEAAHETLITRQFLRPILAVSSLAGDLFLRSRQVEVKSVMTAGGIIALAESYAYVSPDDPAKDQRHAIMQLMGAAQFLFDQSTLTIPSIAGKSRNFLMSKASFSISPISDEAFFFFD